MKSYFAILLLFLSYTNAQLVPECVFHDHEIVGYTCTMHNAVVTSPNQPFPIQGVHLQGRTNADVNAFDTADSTLHYIPQQIFTTFPNLRVLVLMNAGVRQLHQPWSNCQNLLAVVFALNEIQVIPARVFESCTSLALFATVAEQSLVEVDAMAFTGLNNLEALAFLGAPLTRLQPEMFQPIPNLRAFLMTLTGLTEINANTFHAARNLELIDLSLNGLSTIPTGTFTNFPLLTSITIVNNRGLSSVQSGTFTLLPSLIQLSFEGGNLTELRYNSFGHVARLQVLRMNSNHLAKIERTFFDHFPSIQTVLASENDCVDYNFGVEDTTNVLNNIRTGMAECFQRFDNAFNPTTPTAAPTTTTTDGASSVAINVGLFMTCLLLVKGLVGA